MLKYFLIANIILSLSYGTIINVGSEEIHDFNSIQDGIDSAQIGDTVLVHSGIYYENIIIDNLDDIVNEEMFYSIFNFVEQFNKYLIINSTKPINLNNYKKFKKYFF